MFNFQGQKNIIHAFKLLYSKEEFLYFPVKALHWDYRLPPIRCDNTLAEIHLVETNEKSPHKRTRYYITTGAKPKSLFYDNASNAACGSIFMLL
jgi:hypothetical protein